ncbi:hypothetical protein HAV22_05165 [Massilia sp. TW-1]|uniref:Uncharacterized protein n=1 Tax=Telluria antibiotica TaxID=2717319 RepID=A0ABX0P705_9BURK|nr:hypothetical protein [Telluria antibiotica]NIA53044.1 hypothetical protein [Telluria antibiotica]
MVDIIEEALAQHKRSAENGQAIWNVAFVNDDKIRGTIKAFGDGKYALTNPHGAVYFCADKVVYLYLAR